MFESNVLANLHVNPVTGRFANESFRQWSFRKRLWSVRKRVEVSSQFLDLKYEKHLFLAKVYFITKWNVDDSPH